MVVVSAAIESNKNMLAPNIIPPGILTKREGKVTKISPAPPSGSPYAYMLRKKEELEISMRERLQALRGKMINPATMAIKVSNPPM